jgi:predicted permease
MLKNVLIFVLLAVPGYLLVKGKSLSQKESGTLSKLLTNIGMPFLIFSSTLKLELSGSFALRLIICGVFCVLFTTAFFFLCALFVRFDKEDKRQRMMRFCMAFANNGFIGIPLARAVFGEDSPVMAYLIILNIITNVLMFSLGTSLLSGDKKSLDLKKVFLNLKDLYLNNSKMTASRKIC